MANNRSVRRRYHDRHPTVLAPAEIVRRFLPGFSRLRALLHWRADLVNRLTGDILEIGAGVGENFGHYRQAARVWAIEPDVVRAEAAHRASQASGLKALVQVAPAENLPYAEDSFDHVVSSLVFCSVADQHQSLREIRRVLKPGGTLHMVEHVQPQNRHLAGLSSAVTPWWRQVAYNCHLDRATVELLQQSGWHVDIHGRFGVFVRLSATAQHLF